MNAATLTLDRFLGGRITAAQPASGFRAGHDTVLLAASVPAAPESSALELGAGTGIASLCLAARVPGVRITGIEIDPELVRLANENAARNNLSDRVSFVTADVTAFAPPFAGKIDHVFCNPPFHPDTGNASPLASRDRATRDPGGAVRTWTERALSLVRDGGTVTAIVRADRVDDILAAGSGHDAIIVPLLRRAGECPKRTIIRLIKTTLPIPLPSPVEGEEPAPDSIGGAHRAAKQRASGRKGDDAARPRVFYAPGLVLHEPDGRPTPAAEAVLRHAQALPLA